MDAETTSTRYDLRLMRRTKAVASQVQVNDLVGPVSIVGGTPFCGVLIKPGVHRATKQCSTSRGSAVTIDQGRIYGGPRDYVFCVQDRVIRDVRARDGVRWAPPAIHRTGVLQPAWGERAMTAHPQPTRKQT